LTLEGLILAGVLGIGAVAIGVLGAGDGDPDERALLRGAPDVRA
jgi:hypothetical protein